MAKTISIDLSHEFVSGRGESETVKDALAWYASHMADEDGNVPMTAGDLLVYAVRRLRALHKDGNRHAAGKLASRFYAPRLDNLSTKVKVPKALAGAVETIHSVGEKTSAPVKPARKAAPSKSAPTPTKPARKATK